MLTIEGCALLGPVWPVIDVNANVASCPACGEVIYPELRVLRNHDVHNWGHSARWYARDLGIVVHGCGAESSWESDAAFEASAV